MSAKAKHRRSPANAGVLKVERRVPNNAPAFIQDAVYPERLQVSRRAGERNIRGGRLLGRPLHFLFSLRVITAGRSGRSLLDTDWYLT